MVILFKKILSFVIVFIITLFNFVYAANRDLPSDKKLLRNNAAISAINVRKKFNDIPDYLYPNILAGGVMLGMVSSPHSDSDGSGQSIPIASNSNTSFRLGKIREFYPKRLKKNIEASKPDSAVFETRGLLN